MIPYILLLAFPFIAACYDFLGHRYHNRGIDYLIFITFVCVVGLTDGNGLDWKGTSTTDGYGLIDYRSLGFSELSRFEPGFVLVNIILGNFHLFLMIMAVSCFFMVWNTIKKLGAYRYIAMFVYLSTMTLYCYMGVYRHAIAQTILIFSWQYINDRKKISLCILCACLFHYSAFIAFLYLLIPKSKIISIKTCCALCVIILLIRPYILPLLLLVSIFMPGETSGKIDLYLNADDFGDSISYFQVIFKLFIYFVAYKFVDNRNRLNCFLVNCYAVSIIIYLCLSFSPTFGRLTFFFSCSEIMLVPISIRYMNSKKKRLGLRIRQNAYVPELIYFCIITVSYSYMYVNMLFKFKDIYIPYKSILF